MKKLIVGVFFLIAGIISAQNEIVITLENIDELKVYNGLKVNLIKSEEQKVVITGEKAPQVTVKNKKGTLKIALNIASTFTSKIPKIDLYYNSNIAELDANQGAIISSKEVFKQPQLNVSSQEGAYIKLEIEVDYLKAKSITGGNIQLKGIAKSQNINLVSGSKYEAINLKTEQATLYVSTGSKAEVSVTEILDAKAKLGGVINFYDRPKSVTTTESMGGKINNVSKKVEDKIEKALEETAE